MYKNIFPLYAQTVAVLQIDFSSAHPLEPPIVLAPYEVTVCAGRAEP